MTKREQFRKVVATMVDNKVSERHIAGALGISRTTVWQIKQDLKAEKAAAK